MISGSEQLGWSSPSHQVVTPTSSNFHILPALSHLTRLPASPGTTGTTGSASLTPAPPATEKEDTEVREAKPVTGHCTEWSWSLSRSDDP
jgi:hypothetical protein